MSFSLWHILAAMIVLSAVATTSLLRAPTIDAAARITLSSVSDGPAVLHEQPATTSKMALDIPPYRIVRPIVNSNIADQHLVPVSTLANYVVQVVCVESPVHIHEVARRIAGVSRVKRIGNRMEAAIQQACRHAERKGDIRIRGDFLWISGMVEPQIRGRSGLPAGSRDLNLVGPEELALAIERVVTDSYGILVDDIPASVCHLFGFGRVSADLRVGIDTAVIEFVEQGRLQGRDGMISMGTGGTAVA